MNKITKEYYRNIKTLLPAYGKEEKRLFNDIYLRLDELSHTKTDLTYEQICEELGSPQEVISEYFFNADINYLVKKIRLSNYIRFSIITFLIILFVLSGVRSYFLYQSDKAVQNDIVVYEQTYIE